MNTRPTVMEPVCLFKSCFAIFFQAYTLMKKTFNPFLLFLATFASPAQSMPSASPSSPSQRCTPTPTRAPSTPKSLHVGCGETSTSTRKHGNLWRSLLMDQPKEVLSSSFLNHFISSLHNWWVQILCNLVSVVSISFFLGIFSVEMKKLVCFSNENNFSNFEYQLLHKGGKFSPNLITSKQVSIVRLFYKTFSGFTLVLFYQKLLKVMIW